jgi:hypothetical protein
MRIPFTQAPGPAPGDLVGTSWLAGAVAKTQYYTPASIDGFIAGPGNWTDWLFQVGIAPVLLGGGTPLLSRRIASQPG